uniref:MANSC domain-containing protein 1 isoform X3 n=1 Tax=Gasterosteus aculeatus aculeatus TaxID=481459 RepID=UPI001A98AF61|nr:MANSC domain-containing protein 1 isoform X3 [Gasterosteus aculeatus aculeatus]
MDDGRAELTGGLAGKRRTWAEVQLGGLWTLASTEPRVQEDSRSAMTPPARPLLLLLMVMMTSLPASAVEPETCFSRQHQSAIVNVRQARPSSAMSARKLQSERDCVLACCSEDVKPGAKCNMAVFNGNKDAGEENCFLFHCKAEQDCPLMKAEGGVNTYDIYKGLIHPTTVRPVTMTTTTEQTPPPPPHWPRLHSQPQQPQ